MSRATENRPPVYITREGAKRLQAELADLLRKERPVVVQDVADAAAQGDRSENAEYIYGKKKLREIDRRIQWLTRRLESATVVEPRTDGATTAFFGAYVEVEDEDGARTTYRIVGEDEIDLDKGHISWRSPLGRSLLKHREGDAVIFHRPSGAVELTVVSVRY
jgi:transcription elongation factor GreB